MRFSVSTCYLASLVATLVIVTTSLPQLRFGQNPSGCLRNLAANVQHDIGAGRVKRESQTSETPASALKPQRKSNLPCGRVHDWTD